jgi:hypothetical protein
MKTDKSSPNCLTSNDLRYNFPIKVASAVLGMKQVRFSSPAPFDALVGSTTLSPCPYDHVDPHDPIDPIVLSRNIVIPVNTVNTVKKSHFSPNHIQPGQEINGTS